MVSVMVEECEQIKRIQSSLKSSRKGSWRILKDKSVCQEDKMETHSRQKKTNTKHGIYKAIEGNKKWVRDRQGESIQGTTRKKEENNS